MKAAIYARVSTDQQETENQLRQLRDIVKKHDDWELAGEYVDEESGASPTRAEFRRLFGATRTLERSTSFSSGRSIASLEKGLARPSTTYTSSRATECIS